MKELQLAGERVGAPSIIYGWAMASNSVQTTLLSFLSSFLRPSWTHLPTLPVFFLGYEGWVLLPWRVQKC